MKPGDDPWDDWESADYAREQPNGSASAAAAAESENNARLWQIANSSLSFGPSQIASSSHPPHPSHTARQHLASPNYNVNVNIPPPQAYMPSLKILKRPTSGSTSPSATAAEDKAAKAALQAKNLKDREKAYLEARKKIFGSEEASAASNAALLPPPMPGSPRVDSAEVSENDDSSASAGLKQSGRRSMADGQRQQSATKASQQLHKQKGKASPASPALKATGSGDGDLDPLASSTGSLELPRSVTGLSRPITRPSTPAAPVFGQKLIREPRHPPSSKDHNGQPVRGFGRTEEQEIAEGQPAPTSVSAPAQGKKKKNKNKNKKAGGEEHLSIPAMGDLSVQDAAATASSTSAEEKERKKIALSAAAQAFVPKGLVPARVADRSPRPASPALAE